ncbi:MAG: hypothetical protein QOD84_2498, partial [Acidobacteriaceae bacterium]
DLRITRVLIARERFKLEFVAESFNLLNRDNKRVAITDQGLQSDTVQFWNPPKRLDFGTILPNTARPAIQFVSPMLTHRGRYNSR